MKNNIVSQLLSVIEKGRCLENGHFLKKKERRVPKK
jgi:hypothetical protein